MLEDYCIKLFFVCETRERSEMKKHGEQQKSSDGRTDEEPVEHSMANAGFLRLFGPLHVRSDTRVLCAWFQTTRKPESELPCDLRAIPVDALEPEA